jgi:SNF2 family DNA or RNA helicase
LACVCIDGLTFVIESNLYKFNAVITTYEMIMTDLSHFQKISWRYVVVDEAHRLKNRSCKLGEGLKTLKIERLLLLSGTPIQNNTDELWTLLNYVDPKKFDSLEDFKEDFGDLKDSEQVTKLHEVIKPYLLRRMKENVEKSIAPKEETIIEVELTTIQKKYYRALYERNFSYLTKGAKGANVPNLLNIMMELRKCCNHPYLIKGVEEELTKSCSSPAEEFQILIQSSGKMVLIDKLLPKLQSGGHKVLIFSQMVRVLDLLEDYLQHKGYSFERLDGSIRGNDRQAAIDRFCKPGSEKFIFLLSTRAGGLGINLTAADTVIIFDSDWNPQVSL